MPDFTDDYRRRAHVCAEWHTIFQVLSMDAALPLWPFMNLTVKDDDAQPISRFAKLAYEEFQQGETDAYSADYSPERVEPIVDIFQSNIAGTCGSLIAHVVTEWALKRYHKSSRESARGFQLHSGMMGYWHNRDASRSSLNVTEATASLIRREIEKRFFPPPFEYHARVLNDRAAYSDWDKKLIDGFSDKANITDGIACMLTDINVTRFFAELVRLLPRGEYTEFEDWCLRFSWHRGPYKGPDVSMPQIGGL